jgi:hypothetical protein
MRRYRVVLLLGLLPAVCGCRNVWDESLVRGAEQAAVTARAQATGWEQARSLLAPAKSADADAVRKYLDAHGRALADSAEAQANLAKALRVRVNPPAVEPKP